MTAFDDMPGRYADVAVRVGANVQPGQYVIVQGDIGAAPLVRQLTRSAPVIPRGVDPARSRRAPQNHRLCHSAYLMARRRASGTGSNPCHPERSAGSCGAWAAPDSSLRLRLRSE
ncbi:MAG: aminopeptidase [Chloroflexi bacterium]|nr:aminopeptidase [Chloroflexota bacterium]